MDQEGEQEDQSEQTGSDPLRCSSVCSFIPLFPTPSLHRDPSLHVASPLYPCNQKVENGMEGERARGGVELGRGSN